MSAPASPPRLTLRRLFSVHFLWVPFVPLVFTLLMGWAWGDTGYLADRLRTDGVDTTAEVMALRVNERRDSDGDLIRTFVAVIAFDDGTRFSRDEPVEVSRGFYETLSVGQMVPVRYVPDEPRALEVEPGKNNRNSWLFGIAALLFLMPTIGAFYVVWGNLPSMWRAARSGITRQARVTGITETGWKVNQHHLYRVEWRDQTGLTGQSRRRRHGALPKVGETITVHLDPRADRTWWQGDF